MPVCEKCNTFVEDPKKKHPISMMLETYCNGKIPTGKKLERQKAKRDKKVAKFHRLEEARENAEKAFKQAERDAKYGPAHEKPFGPNTEPSEGAREYIVDNLSDVLQHATVEDDELFLDA